MVKGTVFKSPPISPHTKRDRGEGTEREGREKQREIGEGDTQRERDSEKERFKDRREGEIGRLYRIVEGCAVRFCQQKPRKLVKGFHSNIMNPSYERKYILSLSLFHKFHYLSFTSQMHS